MTRTVLVTGAAGFVGAHLLDRVRARGSCRVVGFDRRAPAAGSWDGFIQGDVRNRDDVFRAVRDVQPDEVYHLAALARGSDAELQEVNVAGTRHVLGAVAAHSPDSTIVVAGSAAEYGRTAALGNPLTEADVCDPADGYGRSKHAATRETLAAAAQGLRANVVRPFNLVGAGVPESLVVGAIVARLQDVAASGGGQLVIGSAESQRDFVDVDDAVRGMLALARSGLAGRIFNLCSGRACSIRELAVRLCRIAGMDVQIVPDPALARTADIPISVGSHAAATAEFGFLSQTPLSDSLRAAWLHRSTAPA